MSNKLQISALLVMLCMGCDINSRQQQKEDARKAEAAANLKKSGEEMHNKSGEKPLPDGDAKDSPAAPAAETKSAP